MVSCFAQEFDMYGNLFYSQEICFLAFRLGYIKYTSRVVPLDVFLWRKEAILTTSFLLCEGSNRLAPKCKILAPNNEAILTY